MTLEQDDRQEMMAVRDAEQGTLLGPSECYSGSYTGVEYEVYSRPKKIRRGIEDEMWALRQIADQYW